MHVLIHTDEYCPTAQACTNRMLSFAEGIMDSVADVTVICSSANLENGEPGEHAERIIYAPAYRMKKKTAAARLLNNATFAVSSVFCAIGAGKADVVITTSPPPLISMAGWLIARTKRALLVYDVRDIWPDVALEMGSFKKGSFFDRTFRTITQFMYRHADLVTTVSPGKVEKVRNYVRKCCGKDDKVILVGNGFDENVLDSRFYEELVEKYGFGKSFTCVYIGNIGLAQGMESVLRLAEETKEKDVRFLLFGKGAAKERLEEIARQKNLEHVQFCGPLPKEQVYTVLKSADLSVIPLKSSKMKDSIPTKLYEALGVGCPVLLVAEGDSCEVLDETGLGRHVSPDHPEKLKEALEGIMDGYKQIISRRDEVKELVKTRYSRQKIAADFAAMLQKMTENG